MNAVVAGLLFALVAATLLVLAVAARRGNGAAMVNAAASLVVAVVAIVVASGFQFDGGQFVAPELAVWAAVAGFLHSVGMLGPYDSVWWWDHLTHTVSGTLLTALLYAAIVVTVDGAWSDATIAAATVALSLLAGVFWELIELAARAVGERFGIEPVLVHYGWRDTAYDLLFDLLGAVAVVALDVRAFVPIAAEAPGLTRQVLVWTTGAVVVGTVLLGAPLVRRVGEPS
ncbi:hypothetical protein [Halobacterium bonnevillei]|uniref:Uncharacterized protein n=1 Tax=Halobacterium bonnevillei TaxID=2692200 RepID=A0A6B0SL57_9EURY|nr:hypothetical protein [Halobacterium bonnevillei]MXR21977.1 hypothetical protein [Halobacterium bonnevillei]